MLAAAADGFMYLLCMVLLYSGALSSSDPLTCSCCCHAVDALHACVDLAIYNDECSHVMQSMGALL